MKLSAYIAIGPAHIFSFFIFCLTTAHASDLSGEWILYRQEIIFEEVDRITIAHNENKIELSSNINNNRGNGYFDQNFGFANFSNDTTSLDMLIYYDPKHDLIHFVHLEVNPQSAVNDYWQYDWHAARSESETDIKLQNRLRRFSHTIYDLQNCLTDIGYETTLTRDIDSWKEFAATARSVIDEIKINNRQSYRASPRDTVCEEKKRLIEKEKQEEAAKQRKNGTPTVQNGRFPARHPYCRQWMSHCIMVNQSGNRYNPVFQQELRRCEAALSRCDLR